MRSHFNLIARLGLLGALLALAVGCQKKCQPGAQSAFTSITASDWRLVESTDPKVKTGLSNFTFLIWHFDNNFTGTINKVENNEKYDSPVYTLLYDIDPQNRLLRVQFTIPPDPNSQQAQVSTQGSSAGIFDYGYRVSSQLDLTDAKSGYYYRFVPFQGIVLPDTTCVF